MYMVPEELKLSLFMLHVAANKQATACNIIQKTSMLLTKLVALMEVFKEVK